MRNGNLFSAADCALLVDAFVKSRSLTKGKLLHAYIICSGFSRTRLRSKLAALYAICGDPIHARLVFDEVIPKTAFLWNSMIRGYAQNHLSKDALCLFNEMLSSGQQPDSFSLTGVLKACSDLVLLKMGSEIHGLVVTSGFGADTYVQNSLTAMYMSCGEVEMACNVFEKMSERTTVSWNTMITGYFQNNRSEEALEIFECMKNSGVEVDSATVVSVLPVCAHLKDLQLGREVHELVNVKGFGNLIAVRNSLLDMYAKCGSFEHALMIFNDMNERDVVSWTAMIGGCVLNGFDVEALVLSCEMQLSGMRPNSVTLVALLSACVNLASLKYGKCIHGLAIRHGFELDVVLKTSLIDMYTKCSRGDLGYRLLTMGSRRRTAPWNALISGNTWNGQAREAIVLFKQMQMEVHPDEATMICLLLAYANLSDLQQAMNIHCYLIQIGFLRSVEITTSLIDLYSKSGSLDSACKLFDELPYKDIVSWSALIAGHGMHGCGSDAILLFNWMLQSGVKPNVVVYTSILYACSHAGLVDEGLHFFNSMVKDHHVKPLVDHYACIVDLLGRAGRLKEAHDLINSMPLEPNYAVWGALLGACVVHENVFLGEVAASHLFQLEPDNTGNYVLLANIYAAVGRWEDVETVRNMMNERGLRKMPGCSSVEVRNTVHMPLVGNEKLK